AQRKAQFYLRHTALCDGAIEEKGQRPEVIQLGRREGFRRVTQPCSPETLPCSILPPRLPRHLHRHARRSSRGGRKAPRAPPNAQDQTCDPRLGSIPPCSVQRVTNTEHGI